MLPPRTWSRQDHGEAYDPYNLSGATLAVDMYPNGDRNRRRAKSVHDAHGRIPMPPSLSIDPHEFPGIAHYQQYGEPPPMPMPGMPLEPGHLYIPAHQPQFGAGGYVASPADVSFPSGPPIPSDYPYPPFDYGSSYPPAAPMPPGHSVSPPPHMFAGAQRPYPGHAPPPPGPGYSPVFDDDEDAYSEGRSRKHHHRHRESTARRPRAPSMHTGLTPPMSNISLPSSGSSGYPANHRHSAAEGTLTRWSSSPPPSPRRRRSTHYSNQNRPPIHHHPTSDPPEHYYGNEIVPLQPPREQREQQRRHRQKGSTKGRSFNDRDWEAMYGDPRFSAPTLHTPEYEAGGGGGAPPPGMYDNGYFYEQQHQHVPEYEERPSRRRNNKSRPGSPVSEPARRSKSISGRPRPSDIMSDRPTHRQPRPEPPLTGGGGGVGGGRPRMDFEDIYAYPPQMQQPPLGYGHPPPHMHQPPPPQPQHQPPGILKNKHSDERAPPGPTGILKNPMRTKTPPPDRLQPPSSAGTSKPSSPKPPRPKSSMESRPPNNNWREEAGVQPGGNFLRPDLMCAMAKFGLCSEEGSGNTHNTLLRLDCGHGFHEDCLRTSIAAKERSSSADVDLEKDKLWCDRCRDYFGKRAGR